MSATPRKKKPLPKRHQPKEPVPPFSAGQTVMTLFKPLFYEIEQPVKVLRCEQSRFCVSGWGVVVGTSDGEKMLDSKHFTHDTDDTSITA